MITYRANRHLNDLSPTDQLAYSASKLGYLPAMRTIADNIRKLIDPKLSADIVVSVPHQHVGVLGNPAEEIGRTLALELGLPFQYLVRNLIPGQSQYFYYNARERRALNKQALLADPALFEGKSIILIDDLRASGAVLDVSTEKLLQAKAKNVYRYVDLELEPADYKQERALDAQVVQAYQECADQTLPRIVDGLNYNQTLITKRLLELLFASNIVRGELEALLVPLSPDVHKNLVSTAKGYFATTKARLTVDPAELLPVAIA